MISFKEFIKETHTPSPTEIVYHITDADFDIFDKSKRELGFHFGTKKVVLERERTKNGKIIPEY